MFEQISLSSDNELKYNCRLVCWKKTPSEIMYKTGEFGKKNLQNQISNLKIKFKK